jgi:hypothetical protein
VGSYEMSTLGVKEFHDFEYGPVDRFGFTGLVSNTSV